MPTVANLTSGAGSAATSFATASVSPTGNRLILVAVHAYISTGSVQPATPTVTGNGITYTLVLSQVSDNSGTDRANVFLFCGMATSPSAGAITISFGATTMTRCAWSVDQSDSDVDISTGTGTGRTNGQCAIAQSVGAVTAGATSLSASYSPAMRSTDAGYSLWGHQTQEAKTPRTSWTELSDVTSVTLATLETQYFAGADTAASASWTTSGRAGGIAIEIKQAAPFIWVGCYGLQGGTTALTMVPPSGTQAGDLEVMWVADKNSSVDPTDPGSGWTRIDSQQVGTGADGVGTGMIRLTVWYRILTGTSTNTSVTIAGANRSLGGGQVYRITGAGSWATPAVSYGSDTDSSTTTFSATMATDFAAQVDDYVLSVGVFTQNTTLPGRSLTIPSTTQSRLDNIDSGGGATGNQIFAWTDQRVVMAGTQSGASITGATSGVGTTGGAVQVKISLAAGSQTADATLSGTGTLAATGASDKPVDAALSGTGTLSSAVTGSKTADGSLAGAGSLTGSATPSRVAVAGIAGTGSLSGSATQTRNADGTLASSGSLSTSATGSKSADSSLSGAGSLGAAAAGSKSLDGSLSGTGSLSTSAASSKAAAGSSTGTATLTAAATVTSSGGVDAALSGAGTLTAAATSAKSIAGNLSGTGTLAASGASTKGLSVGLSGTGVLTAAASATKPAAASLAGTGTLTAAATVTTPTVAVDASLSGAGTLVAGATVTRIAAAGLNGTISATAAATEASSIGGSLAGTGTLAATVDTFDQITLRPFTGTSARPSNGRTLRPYAGTTTRP